MQTVESIPTWNFSHSMPPTSYISPEYHPSELVSTPRQLSAADGFDVTMGSSARENQYESSAEASYASLQRAITAAEAAQANIDRGFGEGRNGLMTHDSNGFPQFVTNTGNNITGHLPPSAFSDWGSSRTSSVVWTPTAQSQLEDPFNFYNGTLHQPHLQQQQQPQQQQQQQQPHISQDGYVGFPNTTDSMGRQNQPQVTSYPSQLIHQSPESQQQLCLPEPSRHPPPLPEEAFSRRGSVASELANTLGTIDIHAQQPQSQQKGVVFKQPEIPPLDIAARRNRRRPAALGATALRSRSCAGPLSMSPTAIGPFLGPSTSVRRIKSTSSNLNVAHGRVQKSMPGSAQRSPLHFQSFAEIDGFDDVNVLNYDNTLSPRTVPSSAGLAPPTPLSPPGMDHSQSSYPTEPHSLPYIYNSDYAGCFGPNISGLDSNLASPPTTPLNAEMIARMQQHVLQNQQLPQPPQSAPPQYSCFPQYSPPSSTGPAPCSIWSSEAPTASPKFYSIPPAIHMPQPLYASPINYGDSGMPHQFSHQFQLQVPTEFPQGGCHHEFQINSGPKVPEFFFHEFPEQKQAHQQVSKQLEPHRPKNYVFANATPDDF